MIISNGIQVNCSELLIRLGDISPAEVKEELEKLGIKEYLIRDRYNFAEEKTDWDGVKNLPKIILTSELPKKVLEAWKTLDGDTDDKSPKYKKAVKILKEAGLDRYKDNISLCDDALLGDKYCANMRIGTYPDSEDTAIWYHQHCQTQGFPALRKISEYFDSSVEPYDGGGILEYEEWMGGQNG